MKELSLKDSKRLQRAREDYLQNRVQAAVVQYEQLFSKNPQHVPIIAELIQIYLKFGRFMAAKPLLDQLLQTQSADCNSLWVTGKGFMQTGQGVKAIEALERALRQAANRQHEFEIRKEITEVAERINHLSVARNQVEWLLEFASDQPLTHLLAGQVFFRIGRLQESEKHLKIASELAHADDLIRSRSLYQLARVQDKNKCFCEAFHTLEKAKKIALPGRRSERIKANWMADLLTRITDQLSKSPSDRRLDSMDSPDSHTFAVDSKLVSQKSDLHFGRPLCFLTGHPRSGTTLLEHLLNRHANISTCDESSALFHNIVFPLVFPDLKTKQGVMKNPLPKLDLQSMQLSTVSSKDIQQGIDNYRFQLENLADDVNTNHYLIDKNPAGMIDTLIFQSILPHTKLIVMLRDPRDIALSCFQQFMGTNLISVNFDSLENTAANIFRNMKFWMTFRDQTRLDWIEVRYEQLVAHPQFEMQRVAQFLEVDYQNQMLESDQSLIKKVVKSPSYADVTRPIYDDSIGRWRNYRSQMERALEILSPLASELGYG